MQWLVGTARRLQPFVEASIAGLVLGLIDIHSSSPMASSRLVLAFLAVCLFLGSRHAGRGVWLCWGPLGLAIYLVHVAAIRHGYIPPFVEEDSLAARVTIARFFPASGVFLFGGALARVGASALGWMRRNGEPVRILPRSTRGLIGTVAGAWAVLVLLSWSMYGAETVYAPGYHETRFQQLRPGMRATEVVSTMGEPLKKLPWGDGIVCWWYSMGASSTSDYWRRWVLMEGDQVKSTVCDYWYD